MAIWVSLYLILTIIDFGFTKILLERGATELNLMLNSIGLVPGKALFAIMVFVPSKILQTTKYLKWACAAFSLVICYEVFGLWVSRYLV